MPALEEEGDPKGTMDFIIGTIILFFAVASGGLVLAILVRALMRPNPPRRLLTLVVEERDPKVPVEQAN